MLYNLINCFSSVSSYLTEVLFKECIGKMLKLLILVYGMSTGGLGGVRDLSNLQ